MSLSDFHSFTLQKEKSVSKPLDFERYVYLYVSKHHFALPGRVSDALSDGCNVLIAQGAGIACSPDTIIEHFFGVSDSGTDLYEKKRKQRNRRRDELSGMEAVLFDALGCGDIMEMDFLIGRVESILGKHIDAEEFTACMMGLQMKGLAEEIGIGHYRGI